MKWIQDCLVDTPDFPTRKPSQSVYSPWDIHFGFCKFSRAISCPFLSSFFLYHGPKWAIMGEKAYWSFLNEIGGIWVLKLTTTRWWKRTVWMNISQNESVPRWISMSQRLETYCLVNSTAGKHNLLNSSTCLISNITDVEKRDHWLHVYTSCHRMCNCYEFSRPHSDSVKHCLSVGGWIGTPHSRIDTNEQLYSSSSRLPNVYVR